MLTYEINILCDGIVNDNGDRCTEILVTEPSTPCDPNEAYRLALRHGWKLVQDIHAMSGTPVRALCPKCSSIISIGTKSEAIDKVLETLSDAGTIERADNTVNANPNTSSGGLALWTL